MGQTITSKRSEFLAFERKQPSVGLERKDSLQENPTVARLPRELFSECKFLTAATLKTVKGCQTFLLVLTASKETTVISLAKRFLEPHRCAIQSKGWPSFSIKGQMVNILGFAGHRVSVGTTQLCPA